MEGTSFQGELASWRHIVPHGQAWRWREKHRVIEKIQDLSANWNNGAQGHCLHCLLGWAHNNRLQGRKNRRKSRGGEVRIPHTFSIMHIWPIKADRLLGFWKVTKNCRMQAPQLCHRKGGEFLHWLEAKRMPVARYHNNPDSDKWQQMIGWLDGCMNVKQEHVLIRRRWSFLEGISPFQLDVKGLAECSLCLHWFFKLFHTRAKK